jgi:quinol-cytochrome oxidoreductase complex cytochrome b subunit
METSADRPTPADARDALSAVDETRARVAPFARTPWWLYPIQGVAVVGLIIGMPASRIDVAWGSSLIVATILLLCSVPWLQQRAGRVVMDAFTHPATRVLSWTHAVITIALAVAAIVSVDDRGLGWVVYAAAGAGFILTVALGRLMDVRLASALRAGR